MNPALSLRADDDPARTREVLRRLELDVTRRLDGLLQGDYRGLVPGLGSEPGEARAYSPGDDVRRMDWNVTARMSDPHVRESIADRELETTVLVDLAPSLDFGTIRHTKAELAVAAVAAIGLLTDRLGNRLGAIVHDGARLHDVRPGSGRRHMMAVLHRLATSEPQAGTSTLAAGLHRLASPARRGGLAVVISDLLRPGWADPLRAVTLRHETLVIEVVDPRELELPNVGLIELRDTTTGRIVEVDTRKAKVRDRFAEAGRERLADHARDVRAARADHLVLRTDRDWVIDLARFVDQRRRRRRAATTAVH
ncbi:MAG: hypothetical protein DHS20C19_22920 [Acidimicrobiales bacterium]|nr:MAG: hypothetical protein DHS20C19_22920 [Acidimicrobiales bacterium]